MLAGNLASWNIGVYPISSDAIDMVAVSAVEVDDLFITSDTTMIPSSDYNVDWNYSTILHASYNKTINAGNVDFAASSVDSIRLKKRKKGAYRWITLFERQIHSAADFNFEYYDMLCRANTEYEYAILSVVGNTEGNIKTNTILSAFDGLFICERFLSYHAELNVKLSHSSNRVVSVVTTLGSKYPYVISNGRSNYVSGSIDATFILPENNTYTNDAIEDGWRYRELVNNFLNDGKPKIIKNFEGKMFLACVSASPTEDNSQHYQMPIHHIEFVEIGDAEDIGDLFDNGFIDSDYQRTTY